MANMRSGVINFMFLLLGDRRFHGFWVGNQIRIDVGGKFEGNVAVRRQIKIGKLRTENRTASIKNIVLLGQSVVALRFAIHGNGRLAAQVRIRKVGKRNFLDGQSRQRVEYFFGQNVRVQKLLRESQLVADVEELLYGVRLKSVLGGDNIFFGLTDLIFNQFLVEKHTGGSSDGRDDNNPCQNGKNTGRLFGVNHSDARINGFFRNER